MREHNIAMGYESPLVRNVKLKTDWEKLVEAFPCPPDIQFKLEQLKRSSPRYDCFMAVSNRCRCYKCLVAKEEQAQFFLSMEQSISEVKQVAPPSPPPVPFLYDVESNIMNEQRYDPWGVDSENRKRIVTITQTEGRNVCVRAKKIKHYYKQTPSIDPDILKTPFFTEVKFDAVDQNEPFTPRKQWVKKRKSYVTPTQLIFKKRLLDI